MLTLLVVSITILFIKTNNNKSCKLKLLKYKLKKYRKNVVEILNLKSKLIKNLSHKISVTERNIWFRRKKAVKAMSKGGYIWICFGFYWVVVCGGRYILPGGGWSRVVVDGGGWWWAVVDGGGSWWVVALFSLNHFHIS